MKVIKKAEISAWTYEFTCIKCDSELEAGADDVKYIYHDGMNREPDFDEYVVLCPVCGGTESLTTAELPKLLKLIAQSTRRIDNSDIRDSNDR
jgi:hypothetical protein